MDLSNSKSKLSRRITQARLDNQPSPLLKSKKNQSKTVDMKLRRRSQPNYEDEGSLEQSLQTIQFPNDDGDEAST